MGGELPIIGVSPLYIVIRKVANVNSLLLDLAETEAARPVGLCLIGT